MPNNEVPNVGPALIRRVVAVSAIWIVLSFLLPFYFLDFLKKMLTEIGKDIYLAISGISATLAGFVIAGMAVLSTILPKKEFKKSALRQYYSQIYNSFHYSSVSLGSSLILGIVGAVSPKDNLFSICLFFILFHVFLLCSVFIYSSIIIMRRLLDIDASGVMNNLDEEDPIAFTDAPTQDNGSPY